MEKAIIGKKIGMTQIFDDQDRIVPVTVIQAEPNTVFGGRLGTYKYYDMHNVIDTALTAYEEQVAPLLKK